MTVDELITQLKVLAARREGHDEPGDREVVIRLDDREYAFHPVQRVSFEFPNRIVLHAHDEEEQPIGKPPHVEGGPLSKGQGV